MYRIIRAGGKPDITTANYEIGQTHLFYGPNLILSIPLSEIDRVLPEGSDTSLGDFLSERDWPEHNWEEEDSKLDDDLNSNPNKTINRVFEVIVVFLLIAMLFVAAYTHRNG